MMKKTTSIQIYLKPEIEEDSLLIEAWHLCRQRGRPQVVFRRMLQEGLRVMIENGEMPPSIREELEGHPALRGISRVPLPYRSGHDGRNISALNDIIHDLARKSGYSLDRPDSGSGSAAPSSQHGHRRPGTGNVSSDEGDRGNKGNQMSVSDGEPDSSTTYANIGGKEIEPATAGNVDSGVNKLPDRPREEAPNVDSYPLETSGRGGGEEGSADSGEVLTESSIKDTSDAQADDGISTIARGAAHKAEPITDTTAETSSKGRKGKPPKRRRLQRIM